MDQKKLLDLFAVEDLPGCPTAMELVRVYLETCLAGVQELQVGDIERGLQLVRQAYVDLVFHSNACDECQESDEDSVDKEIQEPRRLADHEIGFGLR